MSLAPVVWHIQHGPISSQFPKIHELMEKAHFKPQLEAPQLHPTVHASNIAKVKGLTCWSHLNGHMGFGYTYPASVVCVCAVCLCTTCWCPESQILSLSGQKRATLFLC